MFAMQKLRQPLLALGLLALSAAAQASDNRPEPPGGKGGEPPAPPAEAVEACAGHTSGDACSFTGMRDETLKGQCSTPLNSKVLACRPDRGGDDAPRGAPPSRDN